MDLLERLLSQRMKQSEEIAAGLKIFLDNVPQHEDEISACIKKLFAISAALRALNTALDPELCEALDHSRIEDDLSLVLQSLKLTFSTVRRMFGQTRSSGVTEGSSYTIIWGDLSSAFRHDGGPPLSVRLSWCHSLLQELFEILRGMPPAETDIARLSARLTTLVEEQYGLDSYLDKLEKGSQGYRTPRPRMGRNPTYQSYFARTPQSPVSDDSRPDLPPRAPEVPISPTTSTTSNHTFASSQTTYSQSSTGSATAKHWASKIFDGRYDLTPFRTSGMSTRCVGRHEPDAIKMLEEDDFLRVQEIDFEDSRVELYWRPFDSRARILYIWNNSNGRQHFYCMPLTALKVMRSESCLQLCRWDREVQKEGLWANLRFTIFERMMLFYCSFRALKHRDLAPVGPGLENDVAPGEALLFSRPIQDDGFLHELKLYRDRDSGGVRLEASASTGALKGVPVWTAFVTRYVGKKSWLRRVEARQVVIREVQPYVFCDDYMQPRKRTGEFELRFTNPQDAEDFIERWNSMRRNMN